MEEAAAQLQVMLAGGLRDALKIGNVSARTYCLQAYAAVGDTSSAEQVTWPPNPGHMAPQPIIENRRKLSKREQVSIENV
jgi:hypothetical protein